MLDQSNSSKGFTIIELVVVVVVLGVLASIVIVGYGAWRISIATDALKSDLIQAATQLEDARVWSDKYPDSELVESGGLALTKSDGTEYHYLYSPSADAYCLAATSSIAGVPVFMVSNKSTVPSEGECPPFAGPIEDEEYLPGTEFTFADIEYICSDISHAPSGYSVITASTTGSTQGTAGKDIIYRTVGSGSIHGNDGDDIICVSTGQGSLNGGNGNDIIYASGGSGTINGGDGDDIIINVSGRTDSLNGNNGNDTFYVNSGAGTINGGDGYDRLTVLDGGTLSSTVRDIDEYF